MAFESLRNSTYAKTAKGSPYAMYAEVTSQSPYTLGSFYKFPMIMDSNRAVDKAVESIEFEDGVTQDLSSSTTRNLNLTVGQQDLKTKQLIEFGLDGKTICLVKEEHTVEVAGQYQYAVYPLVKLSSGFTRNAKSIETEIALSIQNNDVAVAVPSLLSTDTGFKKDFAGATVDAGKGYALVGITA